MQMPARFRGTRCGPRPASPRCRGRDLGADIVPIAGARAATIPSASLSARTARHATTGASTLATSGRASRQRARRRRGCGRRRGRWGAPRRSAPACPESRGLSPRRRPDRGRAGRGSPRRRPRPGRSCGAGSGRSAAVAARRRGPRRRGSARRRARRAVARPVRRPRAELRPSTSVVASRSTASFSAAISSSVSPSHSVWSRPIEVSTVIFEGIVLVASSRPPSPASITRPRLGPPPGDEGRRGRHLELGHRLALVEGSIDDLGSLGGSLDRDRELAAPISAPPT